ncbi:glutamate receptor-like isoform X2 [Limulus polyphemus]|uniref:Glutamate receptor-like isoform X2 n=1 Tax=Limulus polyphemus TaxID=6850 RepID=A0ABM1S9X8_LIMPO|nr:glutamate receptor-like isoform X2 [Limulus polyphemus]
MSFYSLHIPVDHQWGLPLANGDWTGMVGMLHRREVDVGLGPFAASYERHQVVRFSSALDIDANVIITGLPQEGRSFFSFVSAFDWKVWLGVIISLMVVALIATFVEKVNIPTIKRLSFRKLFLEKCWSCLSSLFYQGYGPDTISVPSRILVVFWWFGVIILMSSFGGHLSATLSISPAPLLVDSLEDLLERSDIQPMIDGGGALEQILKTGSTETYRRLWKKVSENNGILLREDMLADHMLNKVEEGTHAIIIGYSTIQYVLSNRFAQRQQCNFHIAKDPFFPKPIVLAMSKSLPSHVVEEINREVENVVHSDLIFLWISEMNKNFTKCVEASDGNIKNNVNSLGIKDLQSVFYLWIGGLLFSLSILCLEISVTSVTK